MMYFSEREGQQVPQEQKDIGEVAWRGIQAAVSSRIDDGSFGVRFPRVCQDGAGTIGTGEAAFLQAMRADVPTLGEHPLYVTDSELPPTLAILDMIELCWRNVGEPISRKYHEYFDHFHLTFDVDAGRERFREDISRIFRRNGIAYELTDRGQIRRLAPTVLRETLASVDFRTGDAELDRLLETARRKFLDPEEAVRREALEALWDAWERLKTLGVGAKKPAQTKAILDATAGASSPKFREALENEAKELTDIGNSLRIRHSETSQEPLARGEHVDYLFHRLFGLIHAILRMTGRA